MCFELLIRWSGWLWVPNVASKVARNQSRDHAQWVRRHVLAPSLHSRVVERVCLVSCVARSLASARSKALAPSLSVRVVEVVRRSRIEKGIFDIPIPRVQIFARDLARSGLREPP